jgi:predicted DsbA family dithiol-disulfide isomerase
VIDESDAILEDEITALGLDVAVTRTIMNSDEDKRRLARFTLDVAQEEA